MKFKFLSREKIKKLPKGPGVYCFKNKEILYIGKAANIKERVKNHFPSRSEGERGSQKQVSSPVSPSARRTNVLRTPKRQRRGEKKIYLLRTQQPGFKDYLFLDKVKKIGWISTDSEIEALILEANLIKKYQPKYNVIWKDDKNYFFIAITKEDFPRIFLTHQIKKIYPESCALVGPFVDGKALKQTLEILRKVFPYRSCKILPKRPCLWYHLGKCPGPCFLKSSKIPLLPHSSGENTRFEDFVYEKIKKESQRNAKNLIKILQGEKSQVVKDLKKEMQSLSISQDFERATKIRDQILALEKILAHTRLLGFRPGEFGQVKIFNWPEIQKILQEILETKKKISKIEAYDVSNIQGQLATGAMVTFFEGKPDKNFYRRFKISGKFTPHQKFGEGPNDIAMIREVLNRRFKHPEWPYPDLILIDGGIAQLSAAQLTINNYQLTIPIIALVKRKNKLFIENQKKPILLKSHPRELFNLILQLRDEAHRFALIYHKKLREKKLVGRN